MNDFIDIDLELLRIDTILGVDLYLKSSSGFVLYRSRNIPFNEKVRGNLLNHGVKELYIPSSESAKFNRYIENNLASILADEKVSIERKRKIAYESSQNVARELIQDPTSPTVVKRATKIVEGLVDLHQKDDGGFQKIIQLMPGDYSIINHSANVATYSIAIGKSLGVSKNDLYELGVGALLHDIGKSKVPMGILNKPARLTSDEFNMVKEHVLYGLKMASNNPVVPKQSLIPILNHHERLTGIGYPYGKSESEIPLFGLITAVADSFDAMTTNRVYQKALSSFKALEILLTETDNYDIKVLGELLKLMGPDKANLKLKANPITDLNSEELPKQKLII
ncbi:MAG: HD domain-containing protein [candidate division Zixibacteria bacterium]|nr:HD domain-containing protein [candidate division Zixibacteria bacterium]